MRATRSSPHADTKRTPARLRRRTPSQGLVRLARSSRFKCRAGILRPERDRGRIIAAGTAWRPPEGDVHDQIFLGFGRPNADTDLPTLVALEYGAIATASIVTARA